MKMTKERFQELMISELERRNDMLVSIAVKLLIAKSKHRVEVGETDSFTFDKDDVKRAFSGAVSVLDVGATYMFSAYEIRGLAETEGKEEYPDEVQP